VIDGKIASPLHFVAHAHSHFHALGNYLIAGAFAVFGAGPISLRIPGIVLGIACAPLLHGTISPLLGRRTAFLASLFFATSVLQINHSKILVQAVLGQFGQLLGLCLLVQGLVRRRWWLVVAGGAASALPLYTYHSARLAPAVVLLCIPVLLRDHRLREKFHRSAVIDAAIAFCVFAVPAIATYAVAPWALTGRAASVSIFQFIRDAGSLMPLWESTWRSLLAFHYHQGPSSDWYGIGSDPALNLIVAGLVLHGLLHSLLRWRDPPHFLLLVWFAIGLLPGVLSTEAPRIYRILLASPSLFVWASVPLARLLDWSEDPSTLRERGSGWGSVAGRGLRAGLVVLMLAVPFIDFNGYFYRQYSHPGFRWFQADRMVEMARRLRDLGPGWQACLLTDDFGSSYASLRFLARVWDLELHDISSLSEVAPLVDETDDDVLFVVSPAAGGALNLLGLWYPNAQVEVLQEAQQRNWFWEGWVDQPDQPLEPLLHFVVVSRSTVQAVRERGRAREYGMTAEYTVSGRTTSRTEPFPLYAFFVPVLDRPFDLTLKGSIQIPAPGGYQLLPRAQGRLTVRAGGLRTGPRPVLSSGSHDLELRIADSPPAPRLKVFWRRPDGVRELVPPDAFSPPAGIPARMTAGVD
jgi:hypothetical protein